MRKIRRKKEEQEKDLHRREERNENSAMSYFWVCEYSTVNYYSVVNYTKTMLYSVNFIQEYQIKKFRTNILNL